MGLFFCIISCVATIKIQGQSDLIVCANNTMTAGGNSSTFRILDRGQIKEAKMCCVCNRSFTWRKKWARNWAEVTTCSESCKNKKKQLKPLKPLKQASAKGKL